MRFDVELRQMLRDARLARAGRPLPVRFWHRAAEGVNVAFVTAMSRLIKRRVAPIGGRATGSTRAQGRGPLRLSTVVDDGRHALRRLRSQPGTAMTCVAMLALAIGLSSAMFTVADHLLIRPAPYPDASRLVSILVGRADNHARVELTPDLGMALRQSPAFTQLEGAAQDAIAFEGTGGLERAAGARVTPGLFAMLGVTPMLGRAFVPGEGRAGSDDGLVLSEGLWRASFAADRTIIGREILVSNRPVRVIGVMPAWFSFPYWDTRAWRPIDLAEPPADETSARVQLYGRLAPGVSRAAGGEAATVAASGAAAWKAGERVMLRGLTDGFLDAYTTSAIQALGAGVGLVFLVLSANVANLVLARTTSRRVEYSIASAIGASRARIMRQAFAENVLIGLAAVVVGLGVGAALTSLALALLPASISDRTLNPISIDLRAVAATSALGVLAILAAGLPPAWIGTRVHAADSLRLTARSTTDSPLQRAWTRAMLVAEVALASTLLIGAGLLTLSFARLMTAESGLDTTRVVTAWLSLPSFTFKDRDARLHAATELQRQMQAMPGISAVAVSYGLPPGGGGFSVSTLVTDTGRRVPDATVYSIDAGPGFFSVFGIKLVEGREFEPGDARDQVVVSRRLATLLWPGQSAIGHAFGSEGRSTTHHVIGVAREVRSTLSDPTQDVPEYYQPLALGSSEVMLGMRCAAACPSEAALRTRLHAVEPRALIARAGPLDAQYVAQYEKPRAAAALAVAFALMALFAAGGGLFSVLTYAVGRRRREFGVRVALGAQPGGLTRLVIGEGLGVAAVGLAVGAAGALVLSRWLSSLAYGVSVGSPVVWLAVTAAILIATIAASWRPAREAARADPSALLRET